MQPHYFGWSTQNFHWGMGGTQNFGWGGGGALRTLAGGGTAWGSNSHIMLSRICCCFFFFHLRGHKFDKKNYVRQTHLRGRDFAWISALARLAAYGGRPSPTELSPMHFINCAVIHCRGRCVCGWWLRVQYEFFNCCNGRIFIPC